MERWVLATIHETTPRGVYINLSIATTMERMGDYTVVRFADGTVRSAAWGLQAEFGTTRLLPSLLLA